MSPVTFTESYFPTNDHGWCFRVGSQQGFFFPLLARRAFTPSSNARAAKVMTKSTPTRERIMTTEAITMTGIETAIEGNK